MRARRTSSATAATHGARSSCASSASQCDSGSGPYATTAMAHILVVAYGPGLERPGGRGKATNRTTMRTLLTFRSSPSSIVRSLRFVAFIRAEFQNNFFDLIAACVGNRLVPARNREPTFFQDPDRG